MRLLLTTKPKLPNMAVNVNDVERYCSESRRHRYRTNVNKPPFWSPSPIGVPHRHRIDYRLVSFVYVGSAGVDFSCNTFCFCCVLLVCSLLLIIYVMASSECYFSCQVTACDKRFRSVRALVSHMNLQHSNNKRLGLCCNIDDCRLTNYELRR